MATTKKRKWGGSNWCRKEKRLAIYDRDGGKCAYCGRDAAMGALLTLDHILPHKHGGTNHEHNLVTSCLNCNSARQDQPMDEWLRQVETTLGVAAAERARRVLAGRFLPATAFKARVRAARLFLESLKGNESYETNGHAVAAMRAAR